MVAFLLSIVGLGALIIFSLIGGMLLAISLLQFTAEAKLSHEEFAYFKTLIGKITKS